MKKTIITPKSIPFSQQMEEILKYRELIWLLANRDIQVKYSQAIIGSIWTLLIPTVNIAILILVFDKVAQVNTGELPYPLFAIVGVAAWTYFSEALVGGSQSLIGNQNLVKKVYFPRLAIPLSKMLPPFIDLSIAVVFFVGLSLYYGIAINIYPPLLALHFFMLILTSLTGGIWISAISIRFRDFTYVLPFIIRLLFFLSPIGYPLSEVPEAYQWIYQFNPIACSIVGIREIVLDTSEGLYNAYWMSYSGLIILFWLGLFYFNSVEQTIADYL